MLDLFRLFLYVVVPLVKFLGCIDEVLVVFEVVSELAVVLNAHPLFEQVFNLATVPQQPHHSRQQMLHHK